MAVLNGFSVRRAEFLNKETYDEVTHAVALENAIPDNAYYGLDYDPDALTITAGRGIAGGVPFRIGRAGEVVNLNSGYTGYVQIRIELSGANTQTYIETVAIPGTDTDNTKYFAIYNIENGNMVEDLRMRNWVRELDFQQDEEGLFYISVNGVTSPPIEIASVTGNSYSKEESDEKYVSKAEAGLSYDRRIRIVTNNTTADVHTLPNGLSFYDFRHFEIQSIGGSFDVIAAGEIIEGKTEYSAIGGGFNDVDPNLNVGVVRFTISNNGNTITRNAFSARSTDGTIRATKIYNMYLYN